MLDDKHTKRLGQCSELLEPLDSLLERYSSMHVLQRFGVEHAHETLLKALSSNMIEIEHLRGKVLDFGCGSAGSTWLLDNSGSDVIGIDLRAVTEEEAAALGATKNKVLKENGIEYLKNLEPASLDMVTAFMLGPDISGEFLKDFYSASNHALKANGRLLITSDYGTLSTFIPLVPQGFGYCDGNVFMGLKADMQVGFTPDPFESFISPYAIRTLPGLEKKAPTLNIEVSPEIRRAFEKYLKDDSFD